jgi:flagellar hook-associated protein 3 FlgL
MRVNPNPLADLLSALSQTQQQINRDLKQTASGQSVDVPSDDPAAAAMLVRNAGQSAELDQFLKSAGSIAGEVQSADSALNSVVAALQRAITLGTQGANGTVSDSDRAALASEVRGIQAELLNIGNLSYQGKFVFAGSDTQTEPFVWDSSSPSGVRYRGNSAINSVTLGSHLSLQTNMPGDQLFSSPGRDMFQAIQDLITGLENGTQIDSAVNAVSSAYQHINAQRVFYGNAMNQLNSQQIYLNRETTELAQQQNTIAGADLARILSDLANAQTSREATLEAISHTQQNNLFSYMK